MLGGICIAAATMAAFISIGLKDSVAPLPSSEEREYFPDFSLRSLNCARWTLSAQRGNVVLVNVFFTSCGPCRLEIPGLIRIADRYQQHGLKVVGVSTDEEPLQMLPQFVEAFHISYPVLVCHPLECAGVLREAIPVGLCNLERTVLERASRGVGSPSEGAPVTVLIDRCGKVARVYYGYHGAYQERLIHRDLLKLLQERDCY